MVFCRHFLSLLLILLFFPIQHPAFAFDDRREGFILGMGAGFHRMEREFSVPPFITSDKRGGIATGFKLGWGIDKDILLYFSRDISWFRAPFDAEDLFKPSTTMLAGLTGIGMTFYGPSIEPVYFHMSYGLGDLDAPFESRLNTDTGTASLMGFGQEFSKHINWEVNFLNVNINTGGNTEINHTSMMLRFIYLWY